MFSLSVSSSASSLRFSEGPVVSGLSDAEPIFFDSVEILLDFQYFHLTIFYSYIKYQQNILRSI